MGRPKGSKNKPKVVAPPPPEEPDDDENARSGSMCGWCSTNQHDLCRPTLTSQPKWYCNCAVYDHGTRKTKIPKARRKV